MKLALSLITFFVILVAFVSCFVRREVPRCDVCQVPIKRSSYTWDIGGRPHRLCPSCNSQMERRHSKRAFRDRFG